MSNLKIGHLGINETINPEVLIGHIVKGFRVIDPSCYVIHFDDDKDLYIHLDTSEIEVIKSVLEMK